MRQCLYFFILAIIIIFFQDELSINLFEDTMIFLNNLPLIGKMIVSSDNIQINANDLRNFFLKTSFYLTIITEILRYIKIFIFKKIDKENEFINLRKRIKFSIYSISILYVFSFLYVALSSGKDFFGFLFIFFVFWIICCIATIIFLSLDFLAKNTPKAFSQVNKTTVDFEKQ